MTSSPPPRMACSCAAMPAVARASVVWAIAEGRSCAAAVDEYLSSEQTSELPAPIKASQRPMMLPR